MTARGNTVFSVKHIKRIFRLRLRKRRNNESNFIHAGFRRLKTVYQGKIEGPAPDMRHYQNHWPEVHNAAGVKTLFIVMALITIVIGLALFFYGENSKTYLGFNLWIIGTLAAAFGYSATLLRGVIPVGMSVLAVNGAFVLTGLFRLDVMTRFMQGKSLNRIYYSCPLVSMLLAGYFYFAVDSMMTRTALLTAWICLLSWAIAAVFIRYALFGGKSLFYAAGGINYKIPDHYYFALCFS